ncbi:hypothetical protein H072_1791 [Dactylellina haptotyla CBS 200.50]|uniref:NAD-dependent epimerase/dehydratase domain-containing protein n=1 Tax=Dactylellina haptotyla (strain CBS 200.50) TaxID=1284197 RepID=S8C955_DACHA|nr:hypothetical protein H072_1791 [Dactylellina haptotyla CBS 200.50]
MLVELLHRLLASEDPNLRDLVIAVLVRGRDRAEKVRKEYGNHIECIDFKDFDDTAFLINLASQYDLVVNAGSGFHPPSADAFVQGLSKRELDKSGFQRTWMIYTGGCSNVSDRPLTGEAFPDREPDDTYAEDVYKFEHAENKKSGGMYFRNGDGLFNRAGLMVPIMMSYVLQKGYGFILGDGSGVIDYVHIADLADLYVLCVAEVVVTKGATQNIPCGKKGICLDAAFAASVLPKDLKEGSPTEKEIRTVDLTEAATTTAGNLIVAELGWAGHRKTKGTVARAQLGWNPQNGEDAWIAGFAEELPYLVNGQRGVTIDSCIAEKTT